MASKSKRARMAPQRNYAKTFMYWAVAIFIIKLIIIANIQGNAWYGADGENYISGYEALVSDGLFSSKEVLHYWPAGYPILILLLSFFGKSWVFATLSIFQSAFYSFACYFFATQLSKTKFKNYSYFVFLLIILNPTLSLFSISIAYENLVASGLLIVLALLIQDFINPERNLFVRNIILASVTVGSIAFFQPRYLLSGSVGLALWIFIRKPFKIAGIVMVISLGIISISPSLLSLRNQKANGFYTISTNLGATMNLGAGDKTNGGYTGTRSTAGVPCSVIEGNARVKDNHLIKCVIDWYVSHPTKSIKILVNKAVFFWTPWTGPVVNGSMGRNPWNKINPIKYISSKNAGFNDLIAGPIGKTVSWVWFTGMLFFLFIGFKRLWDAKGIERVIGTFALIQVCLNLLISVATLGDHRQRLAISCMSIFLQAVGIHSIFRRKTKMLIGGPDLPSKRPVSDIN